jgi:hypothetical protein
MKAHTVRFVLASDLFKRLDGLREHLTEYGPTFGDCTHSLVVAKSILSGFQNYGVAPKQLRTLRKRIEAIGPETLVDLEN